MNQPQAPDPYATAAAQTTSNENTAKYQQGLNDVNQITPYGSLTYQQTGTNPDGSPQTTATTSLSPQLAGLVDTNITNAQGNANLEGQLQGNAAATLSHPMDLSNLSQLPTLTGWSNATLDPQWQRNDQLAQQTAYDQGLAPGSAGYAAAMQNEGTLKNQAYDQANLANIGTAIGATQAMYNEPLNALSALQSGSQVSQPGVGTTSTPQTSVAGTNLAGLVEQNYQDELSQSNAAMGGLFGLGGSLLSAGTTGGANSIFGKLLFPSDRRLKKDISYLGVRSDGIPIYAWRYVWGGPMRCGPMAQDVRELYPDAVVDLDGYLAIDLSALP